MESFKEYLGAILLIGYLIAMAVSFARWPAFQQLIRRNFWFFVIGVSGFTLFLALGGGRIFGLAILLAVLMAGVGAVFGGPVIALLFGFFGLVVGFCSSFLLIGQ